MFDKAGIQTMSHLSILPTALTDLDRLASVLTAEGYHVERNGVFTAFPGEQSDFDLMATHSRGLHFAWRRSATSNHLELIADVERQGSAATYGPRLQRIVRLYALSQALDDVQSSALSESVVAFSRD